VPPSRPVFIAFSWPIAHNRFPGGVTATCPLVGWARLMAKLKLGLAWGVLVMLATVCCPAPAAAQSLCQPIGQPVRDQAAERYAFKFTGAHWSQVFERLSKITDLPMFSSYRPTGSFTFVPPTVGGRERKFTTAEILEIVNEKLEPQRLWLLRRPASLTLMNQDEPRPIRTTQIEDLPYLSKNEIAKIVCTVRNVSPDDIALILRKWKGPYGQIIPLSEVNRLILIDTAVNLCSMLQALRDRTDPSQCALASCTCRYSQATAVAAKLNRLYGAAPRPRQARATQLVVAVDAASNTLFLSAPHAIISRARMAVENLEAAGRTRGRSLTSHDDHLNR
jgi:type II secretory pathway component GspD/PulD (secretin)